MEARGEQAMVVVPDSPGPVVALSEADRRRDPDGIDDLLDDLLGGIDERGAGLTDVVLVLGGGGVAGIAVAVGWPSWVVVVGLLSVALGAILPVRSAWRRARSARTAARRRALAGSGTLLQAVDPDIRDLLDLHARLVVSASPAVPAGPGGSVAVVAHDAVREVATLLRGRSALVDDERTYVRARIEALRDLAAAVDEVARAGIGAGDDDLPDPDARRSVIEAREEVDRLAGTATPGAAHELADEIRRRAR